jgi:hypothetical protein
MMLKTVSRKPGQVLDSNELCASALDSVDNFVDTSGFGMRNRPKNQGLADGREKKPCCALPMKSSTYERYGNCSVGHDRKAAWLRRNTVFVHKSSRAPEDFQAPGH